MNIIYVGKISLIKYSHHSPISPSPSLKIKAGFILFTLSQQIHKNKRPKPTFGRIFSQLHKLSFYWVVFFFNWLEINKYFVHYFVLLYLLIG